MLIYFITFEVSKLSIITLFMDKFEKIKLGISIGDFNGIGPELVIKALSNELILNYCTPVVYANTYVLNFYTDLFDFMDYA